MARSAPAPEALRTLRQRGSIALGIVAIVACVGMVLASIVSGASSFSAQKGRSFQCDPRSLIVPLPKSHQRYHFGPGK